MARREPPPKQEEGAPEWLMTFSDLMSLLLTFFVLLLSFANMDIQKFKDMLGSIKDAFGVQVKRKEAEYIAFSPSKYESKVKLTKQDKDVLGMVFTVKSMLTDVQKNTPMDISAEDNGVLIRIQSDVIFKKGTAILLPSSKKVLDSIIKLLKKNDWMVAIRGHTDDREAKNTKYSSAWELSTARAAAVLRYILEKGKFNPRRFKAEGYADTLPIVPNISEKNRAKNRRVEFYFYRPTV
ncbi:flagellar motor protein MotB [Desulfothermus okinawensis JCM 13304]